MKVITAKQFSELNVKVPWAVDKLVPAYGISLIFADPKVGKSIMSVQLAHSLATGTAFLDHAVMPHSPERKEWRVLYAQADLPAMEWAHQLKSLNRVEGWDTVILDPGALQQPQIVRELQAAAKAYDFLILDALLSLFAYPDINSNKVMGHALTVIRSLFAGPIWLIHHKRKTQAGIPDRSQQSIIGGVALGAGVSTLYDLSPRQLKILGRVISADLQLKRTESGLWFVSQDEPLGMGL